MKLIRYIAQSTGQGRRKVMERIRSGEVRVNGRVELAASRIIEPGVDRVHLGSRLVANLEPLHIVLYKPRATVCTRSDPEGRRTIYDLLPASMHRAISVGRLDYHTTGTLLLTSDGALAQRLMQPRWDVPRSYRVKVNGVVTEEVMERWRSGIRLDGRPTKKARVKAESVSRDAPRAVLLVTLEEGRNRQIHRMARSTGLVVSKIHRLRFAGLGLGGLAPGQHRPLTRGEVHRLYGRVDLDP